MIETKASLFVRWRDTIVKVDKSNGQHIDWKSGRPGKG